jgi:glyoxylase-like metal-dependent hydrolase (beta-lactamase superfamily II)
VGGNWEFSEIYGMDTHFTRANAKGSSADAQAELAPGSICGQLPAGFDAKSYATRAFHITRVIHDGDTVDLGGRVLEVIATPGHTPDAICLVDRKNGLLFTGDNYYAGPIWLYRPETDLDAYVRSVERFAALAPELRLLLPSHNVPVDDPAQLPKLAAAIQKVRAGKVQPVSAGEGKVHYKVDGFIFLMAAPKQKPRPFPAAVVGGRHLTTRNRTAPNFRIADNPGVTQSSGSIWTVFCRVNEMFLLPARAENMRSELGGGC